MDVDIVGSITAGDGVYSYGKVFLFGLVRHGVISSGNIYV
jgi:hypothetical protein